MRTASVNGRFGGNKVGSPRSRGASKTIAIVLAASLIVSVGLVAGNGSVAMATSARTAPAGAPLVAAGTQYSSDTAGYFHYNKSGIYYSRLTATVTVPTITCAAGNEGEADGIYISGPGGSPDLAWIFLEPLCNASGVVQYQIFDDVQGRWFNEYGPCAADIADPNYCEVYASPGQTVELTATVTRTSSTVTWDDVGNSAPGASGSLSGVTGGEVGEWGMGLTSFGEPIPATTPVTFSNCTVKNSPLTHGSRYVWGSKGDVFIRVSKIVSQAFTLTFH
jgi:hypothetical protein